MEIENVVVVATVREDIRDHTLRVDVAEIPRRVETVLAGRFSSLEGVNAPPTNSRSGAAKQEFGSAIGVAASPNAMGDMKARTIAAVPTVDPEQATRAGDCVGDSDDKQLVSSVVALSRVAT
jgi:hypothetical protein